MVGWVTEEKLEEAKRRIVSALQPERIILFGSAVREVSSAQDADLLVILKEMSENKWELTKKAYRAVKGLFLPWDIIVVTRDLINEFGKVSGFVYKEALEKGKVIYERREE